MAADLDNFEIFPWNDNFATGIAIIDTQHKKLIDLLNELTDSLVLNDTIELMRIFDELVAYAKYHFDTEEAIWKPCFGSDPWLQNHQQMHSAFLPEVIKLRQEQQSRPFQEVTEHIIKFLIRWLALHIIDSDKRMAIVLQNMATGATLADAKRTADEQMSESAQILTNTVLVMYDKLSTRTLDLMRERLERKKVEEKLQQANLELEKLTITDQLTGLHNRRYFDEIFELELRRAKREKRQLSLIMFDIDYFKKLNDHYGHVQGDMALKKVGQRLTELCRRPGDIVFRLGGEEFSIVITDQNSSTGHGFAEKIRTEIEALGIPNVGSEIADHMTISGGIITKIPAPEDTAGQFMKDADARLYQAKAQGRNQVVSLE